MIDTDEKKRIIGKRILQELSLYFLQHQDGMKIQILAAKYGKALKECGGFPEFIEELRLAGKLRVEYTENGARTVWPSSVEPAVSPRKSPPTWY